MLQNFGKLGEMFGTFHLILTFVHLHQIKLGFNEFSSENRS